MQFVVLVAFIPQEEEERGVEIAKKAGAGAVKILNARHIGLEEKKIFFGLTLEEPMSLLLFILPKKVSLKVLKALKEGLDIASLENNSLVFTMPLEHVVGINKEELKKFEDEIKNLL